MICPHCKYEHGWNGKTLSIVTGDKGQFYFLEKDFKMRTRDEDELSIAGCPNCQIIFMPGRHESS